MFCVLLKNSFTTHLEPERELPGQAIIVCSRETARYTPYILIYGRIYAEHLDIADSWKDLA